MERMLINASQRDEKRVAIVSENVLFDFITERPGFEQKIGNIYLARITSIEPSLDAIFVEFGSERHGFLPLKEVSRQYFNPKAEQQQGRPGIRDLLRVGQELMIQVEKEERGNKGAALTTYISLAGSYLVLMPNSPRAGGISRRIEGDERDQLREILNQVSVPEGMGLIVRTAAIGRTNEELKWDLDVLLAHWKNIEEAAKSRHAPFLIHQEGNVVIRAIRDYVRQDTAEIIIDDETEFQNAKHYLEQIRPDVADRVKLYSDSTPLFIRYGIEHQIETAYKRTIDLPSGASIVIDYTEALVSIDINSARATKGSNIEATAFNTNIEAAEEIARQLRLRDIGGLIVIDFIDMLETNNQAEVEKHLSKCLKNDRARIQIQRISRFGLLEMSRQRLRPSLRDSHQHVCPTCAGHGSIRSVDSVALSLVRIIEEEALKPHTAEIIIQASTEASTYLLNEKRHLLASIEKNHDVKVSVIPNPNLQSSNFLKKRIRSSDTDDLGLSSSERLQEPQVDIQLPSASDKTVSHQPAVKQIIPTRPEKSAAGGGLIKRLLNSMFGQQEEGEEDGGERRGRSTSTTETRYQPKSSYQQRPSASRQRSRRPARGEESYEGQDSRDRSSESRERSGSNRRHAEGARSGDRSESRYGEGGRSGDRSESRHAESGRSSDRTESRQRGGGSKRGGGRNTASSKSNTSKTTQYSENYQDPYKEYSQEAELRSPAPASKSSGSSEALPKPTAIEKVSEEAPITIKASRSPSGSSAPAGSISGQSSTPTVSATNQSSSSSSSTATSTFNQVSGSSSTSKAPFSSQAAKEDSSSGSGGQGSMSPSSAIGKTVSQGFVGGPSSAGSATTSSVSTNAPTPSASTSTQSNSISSTSASTGSVDPVNVQASTPSSNSRKPSTTTFSPSSASATRTFTTYAPSSSAGQKTPPSPQNQPSPTTSESPSSISSPASQTSSTSAAPENVETQKPLVIRATTEDKTSSTPTTALEKKDKESTDI